MRRLGSAHPLIDAAREVAESQDFSVGSVELPGEFEPVMAIENEYSFAALLAADRWSELSGLARELDLPLANWVAARNAGEKLWDVYLVCLVQQDIEISDDVADAGRFEADTRRVRKYVRDGVLPEVEPVSAALSALLPLTEVESLQNAKPLDALTQKLQLHGVGAATALLSVERFSASGEIDVFE